MLLTSTGPPGIAMFLRNIIARPKLFSMKQRVALLKFILAAAFLSAGINPCAAQAVRLREAPQTGVILTKLSPPIYPALAHQASIQGDVAVTVLVRPDGSVKSSVVSGHPMLAPAASASALRSQFECRGCSDAVTPYAMVYTFQIAADKTIEVANNDGERQSIHVTRSENHVTVLAEPVEIICAYTATLRFRVRAAKCLYLWRCSVRQGNFTE